MKICLLVLCLVSFFGASTLLGQSSVFGKEVEVRYSEMTIIEMLIDIEKQSGVQFYYDPNVLPYYKISCNYGRLTIYEALNRMMAGNNVSFLAKGTDGIMICRKGSINREYLEKVIKRVDSGQMELPEFLKPYELSLEVGEPNSNPGSASVQLTFYDNQNLEPLPGVSVSNENVQANCVTNLQGQCALQLVSGTYKISGKLIGYRDLSLTLLVKGSGNIRVPMEQRLQNLQEVVVQGANQQDKVKNISAGVETLSSKEIKSLPTFGGEADIVKSLTILPGVSNGGEGTAGFSVRGGNIDQNLVLQGNLPFLNTSHALGFYSVFNADVVGNITLHKGDIPARYGGRLSSVLDVELKTPDFSRWKGQVSASTISGRAAIEGSILKNRVAILVGGRRSYSDYLLRQAKLPDIKNSSAWFGDLTGKIIFRLSDRTSASIEGITTSDFFRFGKSFGYEWKTQAVGITAKHAISKQVFLEGHYGVSDLSNEFFDQSGSESFILDGGMFLRKAHLHTKYIHSEKASWQAGIQLNGAFGKSQNLSPYSSSSAVLSKKVGADSGVEMAVFAEGEIKLSNKLQARIGLRGVQYNQIGAGQVRVYSDNPLISEAEVDTIFYQSGQKMASYNSLEPRISMSYLIDDETSIKLSYNRAKQFLHLITNSIGATPADVWQPSTRYIKPQSADNMSIGFAHQIEHRKQEIGIDVFYRLVDDVPVYRDFAKLLLNDHLETEVVPGEMKSYGLELAWKKSRGRLQIQSAYTWSRVWQRTTSDVAIAQVDEGQWFRGLLDQPHQLTVFGKWLRNPSNYFTANFTYRTGRPFAAPRSGYAWQQTVVPYFDARSNVRIGDMHRLDIGYTYDQSQRKLKGLRWILQLSLYNVYSRENPLSVYFKRNQNGTPTAFQFSPIGATIPSAQITFLL